MSLENEAMRNMAQEKLADKAVLEDMEQMVEDAEPRGGGIGIDFSFLLAKTGTGAIADYVEHPLNFKRSNGMAQVLRGCTGLVGELDLAIIDIGLGCVNLMKEGKSNGDYNAGE